MYSIITLGNMSETGEFYKPQTTVPVKTELVDDNSAGFVIKSPAPFAAVDILPPPIPPPKRKVGILEKLGIKKQVPANPSEVKPSGDYARLSEHHGRSIVDVRVNRKVVWEDEFGNVFGARDWKGATITGVHIVPDQDSPYGVTAWGLKDNVGLDRIKKVSRIMRANGLPTEVPIVIRKVLEVHDREEMIPLEEWREKQLRWFRISADSLRRQGKADTAVLADKLRELTERYFKSTDFYIVERDLQVAERLRDIGTIKTAEDFRQIVEPIFKWVNVVVSFRKEGIIPDTPAPGPFSFDVVGVQRYFGEWLPSQMGIYLARLHRLGLAHGFPHAQNWSAVGTLYDLDSVYGVPLGDSRPTEGDLKTDVERTKGAINELWSSMYGQSYLLQNFAELKEHAQDAFLRSYTHEQALLASEESESIQAV